MVSEVERRIESAQKLLVIQRNYRRARDRAMTKLARAHKEEYLQLLEREKAKDEETGRRWLDIAGNSNSIESYKSNHIKITPKVPLIPVMKERTQATMEEKNENRRIAREYSRALGYSRKEIACLLTLWTRESRFDHLAKPRDRNGRPVSSAFGIAQLLGERSGEPELQVLHGLRYLDHRFGGSACSALRHSDRRGWY